MQNGRTRTIGKSQEYYCQQEVLKITVSHSWMSCATGGLSLQNQLQADLPMLKQWVTEGAGEVPLGPSKTPVEPSLQTQDKFRQRKTAHELKLPQPLDLVESDVG